MDYAVLFNALRCLKEINSETLQCINGWYIAVQVQLLLLLVFLIVVAVYCISTSEFRRCRGSFGFEGLNRPFGCSSMGIRGINVCQWQGVKECLNGRVIKLVVEKFNLSGTLDGKSLNQLDQLRVLSFKENSLSGQIPELSGLANLKSLFLNNNKFSGKIPVSLSMMHRLKVVVLSVPLTAALIKFNESSFVGNIDLCGEQIRTPCNFGPSASPSYPVAPTKTRHRKTNTKLTLIIVLERRWICPVMYYSGPIADVFEKNEKEKEVRSKVVAQGVEEGATSGVASGDQQMSYSLEDLLKASAETLGRGTMGSTYKAVMESGYILTVKRLKDARYPTMEEFRRHIEIVGRLRHPNLVPLRAYFQAKEERLLVYDYFPNGSLFSLIHGSRAAGGSKPLHWTSCLKIAEDLAGLLYIHQNPGLTHGNLKSTNVLLGSDLNRASPTRTNPFETPTRTRNRALHPSSTGPQNAAM
ncbi:hypothetical protein DH2020_043788 [Rehmannia glutinosa]|uniref:Protein kinase domain-containing protein n=1 Tax=Rehmannia glutinosa TaxID=99300 RepID=A0ABR0UJ38_REHGL